MSRPGKRKSFFILFIGIVLLIAALAACAPSTPQSQPEPAGPSAAAPQEVQRVSLEESKSAFDNGAAVFVDVRDADAYASSHIPGALSISLAEIEARMTELDPGQWIITYCT